MSDITMQNTVMENPSPEARRQDAPFSLPSIATMTQGMGPAESSPSQLQSGPSLDMRDSGNWSMQSAQSKHSSTVSSNTGLHLQTILNSSEEAPNRFSRASDFSVNSANSGSAPPGTPLSARFPSLTSAPTQLQQPQPHQPNVNLPTINQGIGDRSSMDAGSTSFLDSRRSSIDSRVNVNMGTLQITPGSPYESTNASQASLASSLQQQRGIHTPIQPKMNGNSPLSPSTRRPRTSSGHPPVRRAPPIVSNPRSGGMPDPTASTPTKGFAWAFPDKLDDDDMNDSTSPESSRQPSLAASSVHTLDSHQLSMRDGPPSIPPRSMATLQANDASTGNYSRTPELRVSHKLAERKRRSEMKDLFDQLNRSLPNSPGNKSSKWEILSKAIEYIDFLKGAFDQNQRESEKLRAELEHGRSAMEENRVASNEITAMYQQLLRVDPNGHHVFGPKTQHLVQQESQTPGRLAPMQSPPPQGAWPGPSGSGTTGGGAMQGVEYGNHYDRR